MLNAMDIKTATLNGVATIEIARPHKKNALTAEMYSAMAAALRAAVHFVATSEDFHAAVSRAVTFAGPANYCPVIVGAAAGARWGAASIPSADLSHCTSLGRIEAAADKLADTWQSGQAR